jgi:hypothetical protein
MDDPKDRDAEDREVFAMQRQEREADEQAREMQERLDRMAEDERQVRAVAESEIDREQGKNRLPPREERSPEP